MADEAQDNKQQEAINYIGNYFTSTRSAQINALTNEEMYNLLHELESTDYWIAILKYGQQRSLVAQSAINVLDPHKDPTGIARNQGAMIGIVDLQNGIIQLVEERKRKAKEAQAAKDAEAEEGGLS